MTNAFRQDRYVIGWLPALWVRLTLAYDRILRPLTPPELISHLCCEGRFLGTEEVESSDINHNRKLFNKSGRNGSHVRLSKSPVTSVAVIVGKCAPGLIAVTENTWCHCAFGRSGQEWVHRLHLGSLREKTRRGSFAGSKRTVVRRHDTWLAAQSDCPHKMGRS